MKKLKGVIRGQKGFTLIELVVVIGILSAILVPVVSGTVSGSRSSRKDSNLKRVGDAVSRYESDNSGVLPITESTDPTTSLINTDGNLKIVVVVLTTASSTAEPVDFPSVGLRDVTCGSTSTSTVGVALNTCFGTIDFSGKLVPIYVSKEPAHSGEAVVASLVTGADLTIIGINTEGNGLELYLDTAMTSSDGFLVWNVGKNNRPIVLVSDSSY